MGDDDKLGETGELADDFRETADIGVVQGGVEFVEHAQGRGFHHVDSEKQGHGCHGPLTTRKEGDTPKLSARRLGDDFNPTFQGIFSLDHGQVSRPTHEQAFEGELKVLSDLLKGVGEKLE